MKLPRTVRPISYTEETIALLEVLALTNKDVEEGMVRPAAEAFKRIRERVKD